MVRIVSLSVLLTLIVVLGLTFFKVLAPFILPLFLAAVFAILCQPIYAYFLERSGQRVRLASALTTGSVVSIILIPLIVGTVLASLQLFVVATNLSDRNLGRTLRETTDPVLQYVADFINARTMPRVIARERDEASELEGLNSSLEDVDDAEGVHGPDDSIETGRPADDSPPVIVTPPGTDGLSSPPIEPAVADFPSTTVDGTRDLTEDDPDASTAVDTPVAPAPVPAPPLRQRLTAEHLRQQIQVWIRDTLARMGEKSLGVAGGTFDILSGSLVAIASAALAFVIFAISLYYFLADGTQLVRATERLIPVHVAYQRQMLSQFSKVVRAVVMATFFAALAQAIATVAALWLLGFDHLFIIFILALLMSMIPMMGTWLVWLPCAIYLVYNGHWFQAALLTIYGSAFVGMLDNVVRTYILNTDVKLHPLLALISVLGGLQVMGLWGMFVGPIVASCLHALVKIFNHELSELSKEKFAGLETLEPGTELSEQPSPPVIPTPAAPLAKRQPDTQNAPPKVDGDEPFPSSS